MKAGNVVVIGRPNVGKSTLINALVGQKITITSPKPQTTRRVIKGIYWDDRGQIIFWDTPGIFEKVKDPLSKKVNLLPGETLKQADLVLYVVDHTRPRGKEENKTLGLVRKTSVPKILAYNKIDIQKPDFTHEYAVYEEEFDDVVKISALKKLHLKTLLEKIFLLLPEQEPLFDPQQLPPLPALDLTPQQFLAELIREKIFLLCRHEVPYTVAVKVEKIEERKNVFLIEAKILTLADRYKKIIIGKQGKMIKAIGTMARKEIELFTGKRVYLALEVLTDPHWQEYFPLG